MAGNQPVESENHYPYPCILCGTMVLESYKCPNCKGANVKSTALNVMRDFQTGNIIAVTENWIN